MKLRKKLVLLSAENLTGPKKYIKIRLFNIEPIIMRTGGKHVRKNNCCVQNFGGDA